MKKENVFENGQRCVDMLYVRDGILIMLIYFGKV